MAEVLSYWPELRKRNHDNKFSYPWAQWTDLDSNGHGDIWLADQGIDWPSHHRADRFRMTLYDRAQYVTRQRKKKAPMVPKRVRLKSTGQETIRRVPDFTPLKVKVKMVSDTQIAFQFYEGDEPPPEPTAGKIAVPRRTPMRRRTAPVSRLQKVGS